MISRRIYAAALATLAWLAAFPQTRLTLEECIAAAEKNNYGVRAAETGAEKARIMQGTAWDMERTSLSLSQDPTSGGSPDNSLSVSQSFEFPTVYALRRKSLKAETEVAKSRAKLSRKQLAAQVAETYVQMVFALEKKRILSEQDTIASEYLRLATVRYGAGEARQLEKLTASRMKSENSMELESADAELLTLRHRMQELLNTAEEILPAEGELKPLPWDGGAEFDFSRTAEGEYSYNTLETARRKVSEAKGGWLPSFSIGLSGQMVLKGWNPYNVDRSRFKGGDFMGFEVGVGLPLFFGPTRAKVRAATKDRETAELYAMQARQRGETEYRVQRDKCLAARRRIDRYRGGGLAEAREMERIAKVSYENGDIGYVEYMQSLMESSDTRLKYAETVRDYNLAVLRLRNMLK